MAAEPDGPFLHLEIGRALERAARAHDDSALLCEHHREVAAEVHDTLREMWRARGARAAGQASAGEHVNGA